MTIWLLAVILIASVAALGYRQGAIRVGISFFGILVGAIVAVPLGRLLGRVLGMVGLKDPLLIWALGPILVFILVSAAFKIGAAAAHQKVDVYYKYHAGDLRLALWERLSHRLGLCLGLLNGAAYLVLISFLIYVPSYLTFQLASSDQDPKWMRVLNTLGKDLHSTGLVKVARSLDSIPQIDYDMADFGATLYRNPLVQARLANYPAFLPLADMPEFQALGADPKFTESWQAQVPIMTLLDNPNVQVIRNSPELLKVIWNTTEPDLQDLKTYLKTYQSAKYDPIRILGRWRFDVGGAVMALRRAKPNMSSTEMQKIRHFMDLTFAKTTAVARPDHQIMIRNVPGLKMPTAGAAASAPQTLQGQWKGEGRYLLALSGTEVPATVEGDRLTIKGEGMDLVFSRED